MPICGEKANFSEIALTETAQRLTLDANGEPDWQTTLSETSSLRQKRTRRLRQFV